MSLARAASPHPQSTMFDRLSTMYKKYMLDAHVAQWLHLRRSVADFRALHAQTSVLLSVHPLHSHHSAQSALHYPNSSASLFPTTDDLIFVDHTHSTFVLGHIWGDISTETHPYASLPKLVGNTAWQNAAVRSRKFAADTSVPNTLESVEYVWFHNESAMVILSLTTFEPGQPVCHCSEIVFYPPITSEHPIILKQRPELVLRLYRQDLCVDCSASSVCQCAQRRREAQGNTTTASSEDSINDLDHDSNEVQNTTDRKDHTASALPAVAARWRRTFRTVFAGRRHGTLTLHAPASKSSPQMSFSYELLTRGGRALASRIQLHLLSRMPRTPPPPPPLALPAPPPPPHTLPLGALGSAPPPALCALAKQNGDASAERMPDTSLARILNTGHEQQSVAAHCASSPAFDASPDSTRAGLTPALPSPLPLPTSEPLSKRPRTEPPRPDTFLFSLDSAWSPTFPEDAARVPAQQCMTSAAAVVDRPISAITRVATPARSPSPLAFLSAFGKTPSPPAFPPANSSNFFQRFPPTPHIDLPSPFDFVPNQQTDAASLARGPFAATIPPVPDPLRPDFHQVPLSNKHESSPLTAPSLNIIEPMHVPEPLALRVTTATTTTTGLSGLESDQASRKGVKCEICGLIFAKRGNKQRHIQTVHNGLKKFRCDICGNPFGLKADLNRHKFRIHESRSFSCDKCGKSFSQQMQLDHHIRVTHLQDNRPWECKICFLRLGRKSSLTRHEQTVHQKTRFACRVCPKSYSQKFDAVRHERRVHGFSPEATSSSLHR